MEKIINIRVTNEAWKKIQSIAKKENRTVSQQVRHYIDKGMAK